MQRVLSGVVTNLTVSSVHPSPLPTCHMNRRLTQWAIGRNSTFALRAQKRVCRLKALGGIPLIGCSTIPRRTVEGSRWAARPVSLQITKHRIRQPHLPPQHRRVVRSSPTDTSKTNIRIDPVPSASMSLTKPGLPCSIWSISSKSSSPNSCVIPTLPIPWTARRRRYSCENRRAMRLK